MFFSFCFWTLTDTHHLSSSMFLLVDFGSFSNLWHNKHNIVRLKRLYIYIYLCSSFIVCILCSLPSHCIVSHWNDEFNMNSVCVNYTAKFIYKNPNSVTWYSTALNESNILKQKMKKWYALRFLFWSKNESPEKNFVFNFSGCCWERGAERKKNRQSMPFK